MGNVDVDHSSPRILLLSDYMQNNSVQPVIFSDFVNNKK